MSKIEDLKKKLAEIGWETNEPNTLLKVNHSIETPKRKYRRRRGGYIPRSAASLVAIDYIKDHMGEDYTYKEAADKIGMSENAFGNVARKLMKDGQIRYGFNYANPKDKSPQDLTEKVNGLIQKASDSLEGVSLELPKEPVIVPSANPLSAEIDQLAWEFIKAEGCADVVDFVKWVKENYGR